MQTNKERKIKDKRKIYSELVKNAQIFLSWSTRSAG